jgi:hypothetical protein
MSEFGVVTFNVGRRDDLQVPQVSVVGRLQSDAWFVVRM